MVLNLHVFLVLFLFLLVAEQTPGLFSLRLGLGEDGLHPGALAYLEHLEAVVHLLLIHAARFAEPVFGQSGGADVEARLDDVLDALREALPTAAEVAVEHLDEFGGRDVADVLVGQVGDTQDGTFLHRPFHLGRLVGPYEPYLEASCLIFLYYFWLVYLYLLYIERTPYNVAVVAHVVFKVGVFLGTLPKAENVVLL